MQLRYYIECIVYKTFLQASTSVRVQILEDLRKSPTNIALFHDSPQFEWSCELIDITMKLKHNRQMQSSAE